MKSIVAIILAGGKSRRFWPLSDKNLIEFTNWNLLEYHLTTLSSFGIKDFIVICSAEVAAFLRVKKRQFSKLIVNRILQGSSNCGIGNAVILAFEVFKNKYLGRPVYILNCDDIYDSSIHQELFDNFQSKKPEVAVVGCEISSYKPLGYFELSENRVTGLDEKPPASRLPSRFANMSLHLYANFPKLHQILKEEAKVPDTNDDHYERALNRLCKNESVSCVYYRGRWEILKYPWNVLDVADYFLSQTSRKISEKAKIDKTAKITGSVIIEEEVQILEFARLQGPVVVKRGTIIGTGSLIRQSIIGENCVVGYQTEITRSYVGANCWFHTNYIGDSVIAGNVNMGAGCVLANLRLDQKNVYSEKIDTGRSKLGAILGNGVQIGVNTSCMPGVKVGKNTVVGPGVILREDLPDNSLVFLKQELVSKKSRDYQFSNRKHFRELLKI